MQKPTFCSAKTTTPDEIGAFDDMREDACQ
jgi:hypothetical protein